MKLIIYFVTFLAILSPLVSAFTTTKIAKTLPRRLTLPPLYKLTNERRKQLGVGDDEDEYDLYKALETNTDPLISKIIAGSFILVMISLLVVGVVIPLTTDYGEGVCNPVLNGGRC